MKWIHIIKPANIDIFIGCVLHEISSKFNRPKRMVHLIHITNLPNRTSSAQMSWDIHSPTNRSSDHSETHATPTTKSQKKTNANHQTTSPISNSISLFSHVQPCSAIFVITTWSLRFFWILLELLTLSSDIPNINKSSTSSCLFLGSRELSSNSSDCLSTKRKRLCRSSAVGVWTRRNGWKRYKVKGKQNGKEVYPSNKIHDVVRKGLCWNESPKCYQFAVAVRFWLKFEKEHPNTSMLQSFPLHTSYRKLKCSNMEDSWRLWIPCLSANICQSSLQWAMRRCLSDAERTKPQKPGLREKIWEDVLKIFEDLHSEDIFGPQPKLCTNSRNASMLWDLLWDLWEM